MRVAIEMRGATLQRGDLTVCTGVDAEFRGGEFVAIVGPNGAGKSSMLALLAGDIEPTSGSVLLDGSPISDVDTKVLARRRAVMTQSNEVTFPFGVREVVEMGRYPWADTDKQNEDQSRVNDAMTRVEVDYLESRKITALSGGERARVALARVLAQDTEILILDEPTSALDIRHQELVLQLLKERSVAGALVIVVLHDVEAAAAYADRVVLLERGRVRANGSPSSVLSSALLSEVYQYPVHVSGASSTLSIAPDRTVFSKQHPHEGEQQ